MASANAAAPVITSPLTDSFDIGQPYSYTITADNAPTSFGAAPLPEGLSRSGDTISGTPTGSGPFSITLVASNADGYDLQILELKVSAPVVTSPLTASGNVGNPFTYQITATNEPTSFAVTGLESFPGLSFNTSTGIISGTPSMEASGDVILLATNSGGTGIAILELTIGPVTNAPPVIISPLVVSTTKGQFFTYQIEATNAPATYGVAGTLPAGLSRSGNTISGVPTETGLFSVTISATNDFGTGSETLDLEVVVPLPVITSSTTATGEVNSPFVYQITATNEPTSFSAIGLGAFPGLSLDSVTGVISGTPSVQNTGDVTLQATNAAGTATLDLTLTIGPDTNVPPVITSPLVVSTTEGQFFAYQIEATNAPSTYGVAGTLPAGLSRSGNTISGVPTETGLFSVTISATNDFGTGSETLELEVIEPVPVITSPTSATGEVNSPFVYQITATNEPTSFSAIGLGAFPGLSLDSVTGVISGTPSVQNSGDVILQATNAAGTGMSVLTLTIGPDTSAPPVITSPLVVSTTKGQFFAYQIEATNAPSAYGVAGALPAGLIRSGNTISGVPTETGLFSLTISATNDFGTGSATLDLEVIEPIPVITSPTSATGEVNSPFVYQITADNAPTSFSQSGLAAIGGLTFDPATGLIDGTPATSGDFDVTISASNNTGTGQLTLSVIITPEEATGTGPDVDIISLNGIAPASNPVFDAETETIEIIAEVTPDAGESLESVFVRWVNPPDSANQNQIIVAELFPVAPIPATGPITFTGTAVVGFNPNDRQIGGGVIRLQAVATQRNQLSNGLSFGTSDLAVVEIAPLVSVLFPDDGMVSGPIAVGDIFASVRLSSNAFQEISAIVSGVGVLSRITDDNPTDNPNGVFNFLADTAIDFEGTYTVDISAVDSIGNQTDLSLEFTVQNAPGQPVAAIMSPNPGLRNQVFTPAIFTYDQVGEGETEVDEGVVISTTYTYSITQLTEGQGYFPRNAEDQNILYNFVTSNPSLSGAVSVSGNTIEDGRLPALSDEISVKFPGETTGFGSSGSGFADSVYDPGQPAKILITAEFFKANADLDFFRIFVNGEDVTPGSGNLDITSGLLDAPVINYPAVGSPKPGEYVVVVQVTDKDGEVGTSDPVSFTIVPFEELDVVLSRANTDPALQGDVITYFIDIDPIDEIDRVEIFDSSSGELLGEATRVTVNNEVRYRFSRTYSNAGIFGIFAKATTFNNQSVVSNAVTIQVSAVNDLVAEITSPSPRPGETAIIREIFVGQSVNFTASASATPGIASFNWIANNVLEETDTATPYAFSRVFDTVGTYIIRGEALDNFGNRQGTEDVTVIVTQPSLSVTITNPVEDQVITGGESLTFSATADSVVGVASVNWVVNGVVIETDTTSPYTFTRTFVTIGSSSVRAEVTDTLGNTETSQSIEVEVQTPNPNTSDQAFVSDIYSRLVGRVPTAVEQSEALEFLDGTVGSRAQLVADLLQSDAVSNTIFIQIVYRTMTAEWPSLDEIAEARLTLSNGVNNGASQSGSIEPGGTQTFNFDYSTGNTVTIRVSGDNTNGNPLVDPTVTINDPNGNFVTFADDSFLGGSFNLDPVVTFITNQTGTYTATVGGFSSLQSGDFTITSSSSGSGQAGSALSAQALVEALIPEYESRFGAFLTDASDRSKANPFVTQVFLNKHGVAPTAQALTRLGDALLGPSVDFGGGISPGYLGNVTAFTAGFAMDNEISGLIGPGNLPLTNVHYYARPNDPKVRAALALAIAALLGEDPTEAIVSSFAGQSLQSAITQLLEDPRYFDQFASNTTEGLVALRMAELGVFDLNLNKPNDDADGDGQSNLEEIALGSDPTDPSDTTGSLTASIDGTDFVVSFLRLEDIPDDLDYTVQCSATMLPGSWNNAAASGTITLDPDQTGVPAGYERVEFRIDMTTQNCSFVRVLVD